MGAAAAAAGHVGGAPFGPQQSGAEGGRAVLLCW